MSHTHDILIYWRFPSATNYSHGDARPYGALGLVNGVFAAELKVVGNHGHTNNLAISIFDVLAAVDKTYDLAGDAQHGHSVTITAEVFVRLQGQWLAGIEQNVGYEAQAARSVFEAVSTSG